MPRTAFIGVRISWLMLARNSLLARLASSARSLCCRSPRLWLTIATLMAVARARITRRATWLSQRNVPYEALASGRPSGLAAAHRPGDEGAVLEDGREPGDDAHPQVLAQAGEGQGEEVDAEDDPAVGDGQRMPGGDQGDSASRSRC